MFFGFCRKCVFDQDPKEGLTLKDYWGRTNDALLGCHHTRVASRAPVTITLSPFYAAFSTIPVFATFVQYYVPIHVVDRSNSQQVTFTSTITGAGVARSIFYKHRKKCSTWINLYLLFKIFFFFSVNGSFETYRNRKEFASEAVACFLEETLLPAEREVTLFLFLCVPNTRVFHLVIKQQGHHYNFSMV